jgi:hypothetical protein
MINAKSLSIFMSIVFLFFCFIVLYDGVRYISRDELTLLLLFSCATVILNIFVIFRSKKDENKKENVLSLWIKRKRLEEEQRIKELTK